MEPRVDKFMVQRIQSLQKRSNIPLIERMHLATFPRQKLCRSDADDCLSDKLQHDSVYNHAAESTDHCLKFRKDDHKLNISVGYPKSIEGNIEPIAHTADKCQAVMPDEIKLAERLMQHGDKCSRQVLSVCQTKTLLRHDMATQTTHIKNGQGAETENLSKLKNTSILNLDVRSAAYQVETSVNKSHTTLVRHLILGSGVCRKCYHEANKHAIWKIGRQVSTEKTGSLWARYHALQRKGISIKRQKCGNHVITCRRMCLKRYHAHGRNTIAKHRFCSAKSRRRKSKFTQTYKMARKKQRHCRPRYRLMYLGIVDNNHLKMPGKQRESGTLPSCHICTASLCIPQNGIKSDHNQKRSIPDRDVEDLSSRLNSYAAHFKCFMNQNEALAVPKKSSSKIQCKTNAFRSRVKRRSDVDRRIGNRQMSRYLSPLAVSELLPYFYLNINSNAGTSDSCSEGGKSEIKQASTTSVHSSDQYFSTHTDNLDNKVLDSDMEVSHSFTSMDDGTDKAINNPTDFNSTNSKSLGQAKQTSRDCEEKGQNVMDVSKQRRPKKGMGDTDLEDSAMNEKIANENESSVAAVQDEVHAHPAKKHKRKTKTTETLYIKFESSMSKKVTTTTVVKDGRNSAISKPRSDLPKPISFPDNVPKSITCAPDNRNVLDTPRYTKIIRCPDSLHERSENQPKDNCETLAVADEPSPSIVLKSEVLQTSECNHRSMQGKHVAASSCKTDLVEESRQTTPSERLISDTSPNKAHSPTRENKLDVMDSDYASEKESSAATIVNMSQMSPDRDGPVPIVTDQSIKNETSLKMYSQKKADSPKKGSRYHQEKKEPKQMTPGIKENSITKVDKKQEIPTQIDPTPVMNTDFNCKVDSSGTKEVTSRKKTVTKQKSDKPLTKSAPETVVKYDGKKVSSSKGKNKNYDDTDSRDDASETAKTKARNQAAIRKKSPTHAKPPSQSPDSKRRRRSAKKNPESKVAIAMDTSKSQKSRKQKMSDKMVEKKKKKKKHKQKTAEKADADISESTHSVQTETPVLKVQSNETCKTTQTQSVSTIQSVERTISAYNQLSPVSCSKGEGSTTELPEDRQCDGIAEFQHVEREVRNDSRDINIKRRPASSAENVSTSRVETKPVRAAESVPTFTGTVYTTLTKVVQVAPCPKNKTVEKNLQQAELGWNSSTLSAEEKAVIERAKQIQKRMKSRYYLVKPKQRMSDMQGKPRRLMPRRSHADGDISNREMIDKSDSEKVKLSQAKSVQFLVNALTAQKDENISERLMFQDMGESDNILPQPNSKSCMEVTKPANKVDMVDIPISNKVLLPRKEESRSQTTPPRRRRPIWIRKITKEKPTITTRTNSNTAKSVPALVPLKQRQSSENILKPTSRFNFPICYPLKPKADSATVSDACSEDNRTVAYNTWINGSVLNPTMNRATKKLVAKTGSPVDIKEIIEGSSVDGADYYRGVRSVHDLGVRAAKSVPFLGSNKSDKTDLVTNKRIKQHGEPRVTTNKKNKDTKARESGSARSLSSAECPDDQSAVHKTRVPGIEHQISPASSTDVDIATESKHKSGHNRFMSQTPSRKRDKKQTKKTSKNTNKWHLVKAQDVRSVPDLTRVQYYGDTMEFNALNLGLTWMVQSVFSRLPFLGHRQHNTTTNASGDMLSAERSTQ